MNTAAMGDIQITEQMRPEVGYTPRSVRDVVIAVAHLLNHFADDKHEGLREAHNKRRIVANTGVLVYPRLGGRKNMVGYQLFVSDPIQQAAHDGRTHTLGVIFELETYEQMGDRYLFNMIKKVAESIRAESRPSDDYLKQLSTQFMLTN